MSYKTIRSRDAVDKDTTKSRDAGLLLQFPLFIVLHLTHWHCLPLLASVSCLQMLCFVLLSSSSSNLQIFVGFSLPALPNFVGGKCSSIG